MYDFRIKTLRCEWQVVIQEVDQYGSHIGQRTILSIWSTYDLAYADLKNHGYEHKYVKGRWIPNNPSHSYEYLEVQYREVEIT